MIPIKTKCIRMLANTTATNTYSISFVVGTQFTLNVSKIYSKSKVVTSFANSILLNKGYS